MDAITGTVLASLAVAYECVHFSLTSALFVRYGCLRVYGRQHSRNVNPSLPRLVKFPG